MKKMFSLLFNKQRPKLLNLNLDRIKLFADPLKLLTEKRCERLIEIKLCKDSITQNMSNAMTNAPNFFPSVKPLPWKLLSSRAAK